MPLLYEKRGHVAIITLSRPQARNAWCEDYKTALKQRCRNWRTTATSAASS